MSKLVLPHEKNYFFDVEPRVPEPCFSTPTVELFNFDPPDGGGVSDTVPSPKRHTKFYVNQTQGTVESRPPLLYKIEHGGR